MPAIRSYRSRLVYGSLTPASAIRWPRTVSVVLLLFRSSQPRSAWAARRSCHGSGAPRRDFRRCGTKYRCGDFRTGALKSLLPKTKAPGTSSRSPNAATAAGTAFRCDRVSPVLITRSGRRSASADTQAVLRCWPGTMCRSDRCSRRIGQAPGVQHRQVDPAQGEQLRLDQRRPGQGGGTDGASEPAASSAVRSPPVERQWSRARSAVRSRAYGPA